MRKLIVILLVLLPVVVWAQSAYYGVTPDAGGGKATLTLVGQGKVYAPGNKITPSIILQGNGGRVTATGGFYGPLLSANGGVQISNTATPGPGTFRLGYFAAPNGNDLLFEEYFRTLFPARSYTRIVSTGTANSELHFGVKDHPDALVITSGGNIVSGVSPGTQHYGEGLAIGGSGYFSGNLTVQGSISGDGSKLTNLPAAGGDAYLTHDQTFTGGNTFTQPVTAYGGLSASSITVANAAAGFTVDGTIEPTLYGERQTAFSTTHGKDNQWRIFRLGNNATPDHGFVMGYGRPYGMSTWYTFIQSSGSYTTDTFCLGPSNNICQEQLTNNGAAYFSGSVGAGSFTGSGAGLTGLNASNLASGTMPNALVDASSVTKQGNAFNGAGQLVKLDDTGRLPAVDGSQLTGINAAAASRRIIAQDPLTGGGTLASDVTLGMHQASDLMDGYLGATDWSVFNAKLAPNGSGTGLSGIVKLAGSNMTGQLTTASTITVQGDSFSVGTSTLVVSAGKVGIGTALPNYPLEVLGNLAASAGGGANRRVLQIEAPGSSYAAIRGFNYGNYQQIPIVINPVNTGATGYIGIGTSSPGAELDVNGTFRTTGSADIAGWATQSLSANGYAKVGSLYIQWGSLSIADSTSSAVTFPTAFPTACASISGMQAGNNGGDAYVNGFKIVSGPTTTGFTVKSNTNGTNTFYWLAVGY